MNRNHYEGRHSGAGRRPARRRGRFNVRLTAMILATVTLLALAIGGTVAWLNAKTDPVVNSFSYGKITTEIEEKFENNVKENVAAKNTGTADAFIRIKLVSYRTNGEGQRIGGAAPLQQFKLGDNWVKYGDYYYYTLPVAPNYSTGSLVDRIELMTYNDADGGYQSIDVMAETIQSTPEQAVKDAWGFGLNTDGSLAVPQN